MTTPLLIKDEHEADGATMPATEATAEAFNEPAGEAAGEVAEEATAEAADSPASADAQDRSGGEQTDAGVATGEPSLSGGLSAPAARDTAQLFAQSPRHLFLHWSLAADPFAALRQAFGEAAARYRLVVRLSDLHDASESVHDAAPARAQWLPALPDRDYRADLGFHADDLPFVLLLSSAVVRTPRAAVSPAADDAPEFHITPADFSRLLEQTGYDPEQHPTHDAPHERPDAPAFSYCYFSSGQWSVVSGQ